MIRQGPAKTLLHVHLLHSEPPITAGEFPRRDRTDKVTVPPLSLDYKQGIDGGTEL